MRVCEDDVGVFVGGGGGRGGWGRAIVASVDVKVFEMAQSDLAPSFFLFVVAVDAVDELVAFAELLGVGEEFVLHGLGDPDFDEEVVWVGLFGELVGKWGACIQKRRGKQARGSCLRGPIPRVGRRRPGSWGRGTFDGLSCMSGEQAQSGEAVCDT